jgi:uncharacterized protein (DUF2235 family)
MGRNVVICCDGTWNTPKQKDRGVNVPSNVYKMSQTVDVSDPARQVVYYDTGVGTESGVDRWTGGAFGIGLTENILQAYRWLANHYQDGDQLYFFGFSRGAYTVRSLGGLLGRCGLTPARDHKAARRAYDLYRQSSTDKGRTKAVEFKAQQRQPTIHLLGVWDTVGSLGVPALSRYGLLRKAVRNLLKDSKYAHGFHDENLGKHVAHAAQALAVDEKRGPFAPSVWKAEGNGCPDVEQVWFAGVHSNVGGGYCDSGLSDQAFLWMATKATRAGLVLKSGYAAALKANCNGELRNEFEGLYKLIPKYNRPIGANGGLNERVHRSAVVRMDHPPNNYRPKNLAKAVQAKLAVSDEAWS